MCLAIALETVQEPKLIQLAGQKRDMIRYTLCHDMHVGSMAVVATVTKSD